MRIVPRETTLSIFDNYNPWPDLVSMGGGHNTTPENGFGRLSYYAPRKCLVYVPDDGASVLVYRLDDFSVA